MEEGDRGRSVLGVDLALEQQLAEADGDELGKVLRGRGSRPILRLLRLDGTPEQDSGPLGPTTVRSGERRSGLGAEQDLARARRRLHLDGTAGGRAGDDQLAMRIADEEEVDLTAVNADRHPQRDLACRGEADTHLVQGPLHGQGGGTGPALMFVSAEQEEQRIAPELEQVAAVYVGGREQGAEGVADDLGQLLGTDPALACEALGHLGESRDVDQDHRPLDGAMQFPGCVLVPVPNQTG